LISAVLPGGARSAVTRGALPVKVVVGKEAAVLKQEIEFAPFVRTVTDALP